MLLNVKRLIATLAAVWIGVAVGAACQSHLGIHSGPSTPGEAVERVKLAGLHVLRETRQLDDDSGKFENFTASLRQMDWESVNSLNVNDGPDRWAGVVKVYVDQQLGDLPAHIKCAKWGGVWLVGDRELVDAVLFK